MRLPQRTPIFIGCEGRSEMGYAGWLRNLVRDHNLPFHLELSDLGCGAGDPSKRIDLAYARLTRLERNREPFAARYLFLDTDQLAQLGGQAEQARRQAECHKFKIIWQAPTHEAFLFRHFQGCHTFHPPDKHTADQALRRQWPDYRKPATAEVIGQRLGLESAYRVAARLPELADLLREIGLDRNMQSSS